MSMASCIPGNGADEADSGQQELRRSCGSSGGDGIGRVPPRVGGNMGLRDPVAIARHKARMTSMTTGKSGFTTLTFECVVSTSGGKRNCPWRTHDMVPFLVNPQQPSHIIAGDLAPWISLLHMDVCSAYRFEVGI